MNKLVNTTGCGSDQLLALGQHLGLFYELEQEDTLSEEAQALIEQRTQAKKERDFAKADQIRATLQSVHGILIEDTREGLRWKRI